MARRGQTQAKHGFSITPRQSAGCVVVFHEVWGLVQHTEDVCKRIGKLGFAAVAPNLYRGYDDILTPHNIQRAMEGVWELSLEERRDKAKVAETLAKKKLGQDVREVTAVLYDEHFRNRLLKDAVSAVDQAYSNFDKVSALGFCLGGGLALKSATKTRHLTSAVGYYGEPPANDDVKRISVPILAIYASQDEIINQKVPAFVGAALVAGKDLLLKTYPHTRHGFFNDTRRVVYNRRAADESWGLTRWFLEKTIGKL